MSNVLILLVLKRVKFAGHCPILSGATSRDMAATLEGGCGFLGVTEKR